MKKIARLMLFGSRGFSLIDFLIIGGVGAILLFVIVANIVAHNY